MSGTGRRVPRAGEDFADWATVGSALGWGGSFLGEMDLLEEAGGRVGVFGRVDESEARRRQDHGLDAVLDRRLLHVLGSLPAGERVPWASISAIDWPTLESAPAGVVELHRSGVTRLFTPAVEPTGVARRGQGGRRGFHHVGALGGVSQRAVIVFDRVATPVFVDRAARLSVAVVAVGSGGLVVGSRADRCLVRPGFYRWMVQERMWSQARHPLRLADLPAPEPPLFELLGEDGEAVLVRGEHDDATALAIAAIALRCLDEGLELVVVRRGLWRKVPDCTGEFRWWLNEVASPRPGAFPGVMVEMR